MWVFAGTFSAGLGEDIDAELAAEITALQEEKVKFEEKGQGQATTEVAMSPSAMAVMNRLTEYVSFLHFYYASIKILCSRYIFTVLYIITSVLIITTYIYIYYRYLFMLSLSLNQF